MSEPSAKTQHEVVDRDAVFREVMNDLQPGLARICAGYENNNAERKDLLQDMLLAIWRALPGFRNEASLRTWCYRIANNVAINHVVNAKRRKRRADEALPIATPVDPQQRAVRIAESERLTAAIRQISVVDRQLLMLWLEELSGDEISEVTGLSQTNISSRLHRARKKLKQILEVDDGR